MPKELWGSVSGSTYLGANEDFANAQVVMSMSGSWQIRRATVTIPLLKVSKPSLQRSIRLMAFFAF